MEGGQPPRAAQLATTRAPMSQSGRVRLRDLRGAFRLIHDCRDVGQDPAAWGAVLVDGLAEMLDAAVVISSEMRLDWSGSPRDGIIRADRWPAAAQRERWIREYVATGKFRTSPTLRRYLALPGGLITRSREQLLGDGEWY